MAKEEKTFTSGIQKIDFESERTENAFPRIEVFDGRPVPFAESLPK